MELITFNVRFVKIIVLKTERFYESYEPYISTIWASFIITLHGVRQPTSKIYTKHLCN